MTLEDLGHLYTKTNNTLGEAERTPEEEHDLRGSRTPLHDYQITLGVAGRTPV